MILRVVNSIVKASFYTKNAKDPWPALPSSVVLRMLGRGTPGSPESKKTPRKSTDLEQYIILDTQNFLQLQKLLKLGPVEILPNPLFFLQKHSFL